MWVILCCFPARGRKRTEEFTEETKVTNHYENTPIQISGQFYHKKCKFSDKKSDIFYISAQNTDCRYSLELPHRGSSNEYPQSMFLSRNKKNNVPQVYCIKVGFKGPTLYRHVFMMSEILHQTSLCNCKQYVLILFL